jgi:hypothetical protein
LSSSACRIVEIDARPPWRVSPAETRVRSFAVLPASGPATQAHFESLRGRTVEVVVWGAESVHRQVMVTDGSYEAMRVEGVAALAGAGLRIPGAWSDIAPAPGGTGRPVRRPVVVALASGPVLSSVLQPLFAAGIRVRTVMTPAVALGSLARLRRSASASTTGAYVAVEEDASCVALVRDGALVAARDLSWGYVVERDGIREHRTREDVATRLGDELREFVADVGGSTSAVAQVTVCGSLPELCGMTLQLAERLDVEVEALDSLFGIDEATLSESIREFRERGAELRLAWAAAADRPPAHNLLRARRRAASHMILARAAVLAGMAAGLGVGVDVEGSPWWRAVEPVLMARANAPRAGTVGGVHRPRQQTSARSTQPDVRRDEAALASAVDERRHVLPPPPVALLPAREPEPDVEPPATRGTLPARPAPQALIASPAPRALSASHGAPVRRAALRAPDSSAPFDAALGSILYAPDRRLAIIDGRIVSAGDEVRGARVVDIAPGVVLLRDAQGQLRRLALGTAER